MVLIALGANLPSSSGVSPLETCRSAAAALDGLEGLRLVVLSRWFRSAPVPRSDQPDYVNGVARLGGSPEPARLLAALQSIERAHGRTRSLANAARTLDLDIIDIDGMVRRGPDPVLPHPRAHERGFVLLPLAEVAPRWVHPVLGRTVEELIGGLPAQDIAPL